MNTSNYEEVNLLCRVCGTKGDTMLPLSEKIIVCGVTNNLVDIVQTILHADIQLNDGKSQTICVQCHMEAITSYKLKIKFELNEFSDHSSVDNKVPSPKIEVEFEETTITEEVPNSPNKDPPSNVLSTTIEESHNQIIPSGQNIINKYVHCTECPLKFETEQLLETHRSTSHNATSSKRKYKCTKCDFVCDEETLITIHTSFHEPPLVIKEEKGEEEEEVIIVSDEIEERPTCPTPTNVFSSSGNWRKNVSETPTAKSSVNISNRTENEQGNFIENIMTPVEVYNRTNNQENEQNHPAKTIKAATINTKKKKLLKLGRGLFKTGSSKNMKEATTNDNEDNHSHSSYEAYETLFKEIANNAAFKYTSETMDNVTPERNKKYTCDVCLSSFPNKSTLHRHHHTHKIKLQCGNCKSWPFVLKGTPSKNQSTSSHRKRHKEVDLSLLREETQAENIIKKKRFKCDLCGYKCRRYVAYRQHILTKHEVRVLLYRMNI